MASEAQLAYYQRGRSVSVCEYQTQYRAAHKVKRAEYNKNYQRQYALKHPDKVLFLQIKNRAKRQGVPFNLDPSDLLIPKTCPILGIPLYRNFGGNKPTGNSPSVDKIVPSLGYIKGNIQIISQRANVMKNDASWEELERFASWINQSKHLFQISTPY